MSNWEIFDDAFWLTLAGAFFGFGGVMINGILKSRCKQCSCCGMSCERDVAPPGEEPQVVVDIPSLTTPKTQEMKRTNSI